MGYRLVPTRVTYPSEIRAGQRFRVEFEWVNRGVGRAMRDYHLRLTLADDKGAAIASTDAGELDTDAWIRGETYKASNDVTFQTIAPGAYQLRITLIDPRDGRSINLPLGDRGEDRSYPIGAIRCR
jgi:hypothetical protein